MKKNAKNKVKSPEFYRHRLERPLYILSVILSVIVFAFLSYLGYAATIRSGEQNMILQLLGIESDLIEIIMKIGGYIAIVFIAFIIISILMSYYQYSINAKADDIHVTEKQFLMLIEAEKEYGKKLGIVKDKDMFWANIQRDVPIPAYRIDALRNNTEGKLF